MDANVKIARMELDNDLIKIQSVTHGILDVKLLEELQIRLEAGGKNMEFGFM